MSAAHSTLENPDAPLPISEWPVDDEGYAIDPTTGEVTAYKPQGVLAEPGLTEDKVEAVLEHAQAKAASVTAANRRLDRVRALKQSMIEEAVKALDEDPTFVALAQQEANAEKIVKQNTRKLERFAEFWKPELKKFAQRALKGKKERNLKYLPGKLQLTKSQANFEILDMPKAVCLAKALGLETFVEEAVSKSGIKDLVVRIFRAESALTKAKAGKEVDDDELALATPEIQELIKKAEPHISGLAFTPADDKLTIEVGVLKL